MVACAQNSASRVININFFIVVCLVVVIYLFLLIGLEPKIERGQAPSNQVR
jgi:hypothetical protein